MFTGKAAGDVAAVLHARVDGTKKRWQPRSDDVSAALTAVLDGEFCEWWDGDADSDSKLAELLRELKIPPAPLWTYFVGGAEGVI